MSQPGFARVVLEAELCSTIRRVVAAVVLIVLAATPMLAKAKPPFVAEVVSSAADQVEYSQFLRDFRPL